VRNMSIFAKWIWRAARLFSGLIALTFALSCRPSVFEKSGVNLSEEQYAVGQGPGRLAVSGDGNVVATVMGIGFPEKNSLVLTDLRNKRVWRYLVPDPNAVVRAPHLSEDGSTVAFITETTSEPGSTIWLVGANGHRTTVIRWADQRRVSQVGLDDNGNLLLIRDVREPEQWLSNTPLYLVDSWGLYYINIEKKSESRIAPDLTWVQPVQFTWIYKANMLVVQPGLLGQQDKSKTLLWQEVPVPPLGEGELGYRAPAMGLKLAQNQDGEVIARGTLYRLFQTGAEPQMRAVVSAASADGSAIGIHNSRLDSYRGAHREPAAAERPNDSGSEILLQCKILVHDVVCTRALPSDLIGMSGNKAISNNARTIVMHDWETLSPLGVRMFIERDGLVSPIIIEPSKSTDDQSLSVRSEVVL
jgi:hypothetical protein